MFFATLQRARDFAKAESAQTHQPHAAVACIRYLATGGCQKGFTIILPIKKKGQ
uniref:Uncharacterized protein n=1 Tax=viral metagenome TaxID=1070528 RepID=A0A6H1ZJ65_9ZZZZ